MNCPNCSCPDNDVFRTVRSLYVDRRKHRCAICSATWRSTTTVDADSLELPNNLPTEPVDNPALLRGAANAGVYIRSGSESDLKISDHFVDPARAKSEKRASFADLLETFGARWTVSYKRPYPATPGDRAQLGRFMRDHGNYIESFPAICDRYLSDRRQFVIDRSSGHTLKWLVSSGLAMFGGLPRETAERYAARIRKEHEGRKRQAKRAPQSAELRELVLHLANGKAVT